MAQAVFILIFLVVLGHVWINYLKHTGLKEKDINFLHGLLWYHLILAIAYFVYVQFNRSDSYTYYSTTASYEYGYNWMSYYGVSTTFIKFLAYPLIRMLGLSYEACMAIFAMIGFAGFVFFFRFLREQIKIPVKIFGMDAIYFLLLLPNTHFWTSSLGKGSVIFFGVALLFYALSYIKKRYIALFIAGLTIYHIRPHIFYVFLIALSVGYAFSSKRISLVPRLIIISLAITLLILIYNDILQFTGLEDESMLDPFISHRASELTKAGSGIDITNYNLAQKLFAFLFRPLFFDSPGLMGLIVSFENLIYLILCLEFFRLSAFKYLIQADPITKTAILAFAAVSLALAQISGNLGLAIRQKSQVMLLFLFVIVKLKEERVLEQLKHVYMRRAALSRLKRMEMKQQNS